MLIHVYNNGGTVTLAGSDAAAPPDINFHLCLMGVGRILLFFLPLWGL